MKCEWCDEWVPSHLIHQRGDTHDPDRENHCIVRAKGSYYGGDYKKAKKSKS